MVYTQPNTFIKWLTLVMMSASLSLVFGGIFWDVPNTDPQLILNDRLGNFTNINEINIHYLFNVSRVPLCGDVYSSMAFAVVYDSN